MTKTDLTEYDVKPIEMINYLRYHGPHFSKRLCKFACQQMRGKDDAPVQLYNKDQIEELLERHNIKLKEKNGYDHVFVANMCKADFLGSSIGNEMQMVKFVKDYLDDPDGYEEVAMTRFYADLIGTGTPVIWEDML